LIVTRFPWTRIVDLHALVALTKRELRALCATRANYI
jgi:hypothetical protein